MEGSYACIYVSFSEQDETDQDESDANWWFMNLYINSTNSKNFEKYKITPIDAKIVSYFLLLSSFPPKPLTKRPFRTLRLAKFSSMAPILSIEKVIQMVQVWFVQVFSRWIRWIRCGPGVIQVWFRYSQGESGDGQVTIGGFAWAWRWLRSRGLLILSGDSLWASASFQSFYCANTTDDCSVMCSTAFTYRSTQHRDQYSALVASVEFLMSSELCQCSLLKRVVIELAGISLSIAAVLSHNSITLSHNSITANCLTFCHHQLSPCDTGAKTKLSHNTAASSYHS